MPNYDQEPQRAKISDNSVLNVLSEIESELEILPGTINDLQGKLIPVLRPDQDSMTGEAGDSINKIVSNNSAIYERLVEVLDRVRGTKRRIHEVTDRVQL